LLAAHVAGEQYAFEELFYRHHRQLYRLAQITSRNPEGAADALQDAMLSAHRSAPRFRHDSAVSSWLYRIVVNACLDRLRRNKTHPTSVLEDDIYNVGDPTPRVDTAIVVERALLRLPPSSVPPWSRSTCRATRWPRPRACSALPRAP
jgi:RNA polymerase sigma-70 factor, ECF subfamily